MLNADKDRMAIPVYVESMTFHGPDPQPGRRFDCRVRIDRLSEGRVRANIDLADDGRIWCRIRGWEDRRFETNDHLWAMMIKPEGNLLAEPHERIPNCHVLREDLSRSTTRDYFARRYLDMPDIEAYRAMNPRRQLEWLPGRIAAKDAVRHWLWQRGAGPLFPIEIGIRNDESGRPVVEVSGAGDLRVSIANKAGMAAAIVAEGQDVGIDLERVAPREASFERASFGAAELALLPDGARDEWVTRFWAAKEAAAKARGTGLEGNPKRFRVRQVDGERLLVEDRWVATRVEDGMVYAWTIEEP
jgi:phosphopantetheinyl transferase